MNKWIDKINNCCLISIHKVYNYNYNYIYIYSNFCTIILYNYNVTNEYIKIYQKELKSIE